MRTRVIRLTPEEEVEMRRVLAVQRRLGDAAGPGKTSGRGTWRHVERIARAHGVDPGLVAGLRVDISSSGLVARLELRAEPRV